MKAFLLSLFLVVGFLCRPAFAVDDCIGDDNFIYHEDNQLVRTSTFLPAGSTTEFILKAPFNSKATYYVKFEAHYLSGRPLGGADPVTVSPMPENSPYVKSGDATKNDSLARVQVPARLATHWQTVRVRIYGCENDRRPAINSRLDMKVSSFKWSAGIVIAAIIILYLAATAAFHAVSRKKARETIEDPNVPRANSYSFVRSLDPVVLTAGADGKGSLAKLQILFFSVIVFGLLLYVLLRLGELSDLSETILLLLGIAAIGSTAAKATEQQRGRIDFENYAWLVKRKWLGLDGLARDNRASWRDIITSDGEFDVYRYQSCIFSLVVGGALIVVGVNQLASFQIPTTLLGLLGLSQVVYVAGKLVSPPAFADLNKSIETLRAFERDLRTARAKLPGTALFTDPAISSEYEKYISAANTTAVMLRSVTGLQPPEDVAPSKEP
jgi:hypothetical protein